MILCKLQILARVFDRLLNAIIVRRNTFFFFCQMEHLASCNGNFALKQYNT